VHSVCSIADVPQDPSDPSLPNRVFLQAVVNGLLIDRWECSERDAVCRLLKSEPPPDPIFANLSDAELKTCIQRAKRIVADL
jgi:hypothetical protein